MSLKVRVALAVAFLAAIGVAVRPSDNQRTNAANRRVAAMVERTGAQHTALVQDKARKAYRPDRFEEDYSHLQVSASTHRVLLRHDKNHHHKHDEAPILTVAFRLNAPAQELSLVLPEGYAIDRRQKELAAAGCNFLVGNEPGQLGGSAYRQEKDALPLNDSHIVKCEVETEGQTHIRIYLKEGLRGLSASYGYGDATRSIAGATSEGHGGGAGGEEGEPDSAHSEGFQPALRRLEPVQPVQERAELDGSGSISTDSIGSSGSAGRETGSLGETSRSEGVSATADRDQGPYGSLVQVVAGQRERTVRPYWFVLIRAWYPDATPPPETNTFELHWRPKQGDGWAGSLTYGAWPLLGDWDCVYSDWEGWGECSARCGGGTMTLRRRVLLAPPSDSLRPRCTGPMEVDSPCNEHPCVHKCWQDGVLHTNDDPMQCTAKCGGGLRVERRRWHGFGCPLITDMDAVRLTMCNERQCEVPCRHSSYWTPVTECSKLCGVGHFWMIQEVVQKDKDDNSCQPIWRKQACMRQECKDFLVIHPDRNMVPYVNQEYRVAIVFHIRSLNDAAMAKEIILQAPRGYSFGSEGAACAIYEHNLLPYYSGCKVGDSMRGSNEVVLSLLTKMPSVSPRDGETIHYRFSIDVVNADCGNDDWSVDASLANIYCRPKAQDNEWLIDFGGNEKYKAGGYALYVPVSVGADTFHYQDQWGCSGQIRGAKGEDNLCIDVTGKKYDKGSALHVSQCPAPRINHEEEETTDWIAPPTGAGAIRLRFHFDRCACIHFDSSQKAGEVTEGLPIKLHDCSSDISERCQWIMPSSTLGSIRSGMDPRYCLGYSSDEDDEGRQNLELALCRKQRVRWLTPCPGVEKAKVNNPRQLSGSGVLTRTTRPTFCTGKVPGECPPLMVCNDLDGICVPKWTEEEEEE